MERNLRDITRLRWGMEVDDSEGAKIGTLEKVYRADNYGVPPAPAAPVIIEPYLKIKTSGPDLYVPTGQISEIQTDRVILNVTDEKVPEMGWDEKPDFLQDLEL